MLKKVLCLLLCVLTLLFAVACDNTTDEPADTTPVADANDNQNDNKEEEEKKEEVTPLTFLADGKTSFRIAYQKGDTLTTDAALAIQSKLKSAMNLNLNMGWITTKINSNTPEILVGLFDDEAYASAKTHLTYGNYVIAVVGNKILLSSTQKEGYDKLGEFLVTTLKQYQSEDGKSIVLPGDLVAKKTFKSAGLLVDIPVLPKHLNNYIKTNTGTELILENVSTADYEAYCRTLESSGYTVHSSKNMTGTVSTGSEVVNLFATYKNSTQAITLGYHSFASRLYIMVEKLSDIVLPAASAATYTPVNSTTYPTIFTQVGFEDIDDKESSLCYVMRIADGSFIIYDGGENDSRVGDRIYQVLLKQAPNPSNIVISAWIITHPHGDHYGGFLQFADRHASKVTVKQFVYNFAPSTALKNFKDPSDGKAPINNAGFSTTQRTITDKMKEKFPNAKHVVPHTGQTLYYADIKIHILYTQEDYLAVNDGVIVNLNGTSIVSQIETADGAKLFIAADHPVDSEWWCQYAIERWYGSSIESDVCTTFHHGYGGGASSGTYALIKPEIVLWNAEWARISEILNSDGDSVLNNSRNRYFVESYVEGGVTKYRPKDFCYVASDKIVILSFANGSATVATNQLATEYLA